MRRVLRAITAAFLVTAVLGGRTDAQSPPPVGASAQLLDANARLVAVATFREAQDEVLVNLTFPDRNALTGTHALQIHEFGRCDPPGFASAGGIFNPFNKQHGLLNADGPMAGDLPSLVISSAGIGGYNTSAPLVKLTTGPAALLRPGGTSLLIFAQPDDDKSQPDGNVGARLACGVIVAGPPGANTASAPGSAQRRPDLTDTLMIALVGGLLVATGVLMRRGG